MRGHQLLVVLLGIGLAAACGGRAPSAPSSATTSATQTVVTASVTEAVSRAAIVAPMSDVPTSMTIPCPAGGSMTITYSGTLPPDLARTFVTTSRTEFNDCTSQNVIMRGDPYLQTTGEHTFGPIVGGALASSTATMRTTGGLRFEANGTSGRAQYDCTQVMTIQFAGNNPPQISITSSGTITWEQPLGTLSVRPCGP